MNCHETFLSLLGDAAHWEFEIFLMLVIDGLLLSVLLPLLKRYVHRHNSCEGLHS